MSANKTKSTPMLREQQRMFDKWKHDRLERRNMIIKECRRIAKLPLLKKLLLGVDPFDVKIHKLQKLMEYDTRSGMTYTIGRIHKLIDDQLEAFGLPKDEAEQEAQATAERDARHREALLAQGDKLKTKYPSKPKTRRQ